jgi:hypothetical protein|tara:strand:- start:338 stop:625 length:288 start_codon:yes stop_codon:yes gene_type:complete
MNFRNLVFRPHVTDKKSIQASLDLGGNIFLSVVAGRGLYCTQRESSKGLDYPDSNCFASFECAIIDENGKDEMTVIGWQSREDINKLITKYNTNG